MMKTTTKIVPCLFLLFLFFSQILNSQTFKAQALFGINAGQVDGDFEVGFNKIGISTGIGIGVQPSKKLYIGTEFLYSQRGSKNSLFTKDGAINGNIRIDYIELPLIIRFYDWYVEEKQYNKVWIEGGISGGRLIFAKINGSQVPELVANFNNFDLSGLIGLGYAINQKIGMNFRYTRSILPFYVAGDPMDNEVKSFRSYFITLRVTYTL